MSALVTHLIEADALIILTNQHGLYDSNLRKNSAADFMEHAQAGDPALEATMGGTGSMLTEILATKSAELPVCDQLTNRKHNFLATINRPNQPILHASQGYSRGRKAAAC